MADGGPDFARLCMFARQTPDRKMRSRPVSLVLSGDAVAPPGGAQQVAPPAAAAAAVAAAVKMSRRERSKTVDSFKVPLGMSLNNARAKSESDRGGL